jgi:anti-anti-sigma factor
MVELPYEKLTIYECEDFYKFLIGKLKTVDTSLSLDFKNIQKIDMVTIQLLLSLANTCKKTDVELNLINFSAELKHTLTLCGCDKVLKVKND